MIDESGHVVRCQVSLRSIVDPDHHPAGPRTRVAVSDPIKLFVETSPKPNVGRIVGDEGYDLDGDVNKDCKVDALDVVLLAASWLRTGPSFLGDIHKDDTVNWFDFSVLGNNWLEQRTWLAPPAAANPNPPDGAIGIRLDPVLSFEPGEGASSHDVYFGPADPPEFRVNQTGTTFNPGLLSYGATYYWRIDEVNPYGKTSGAVWSFTTTTGGVR